MIIPLSISPTPSLSVSQVLHCSKLHTFSVWFKNSLPFSPSNAKLGVHLDSKWPPRKYGCLERVTLPWSSVFPPCVGARKAFGGHVVSLERGGAIRYILPSTSVEDELRNQTDCVPVPCPYFLTSCGTLSPSLKRSPSFFICKMGTRTGR